MYSIIPSAVLRTKRTLYANSNNANVFNGLFHNFICRARIWVKIVALSISHPVVSCIGIGLVRARKAFPCLDELELKATFQVTLIGDFSVILGNMPVKEERTFSGPNARWWVVNGLHSILPRSGVLHDNESQERELILETTPRMSTYLIAWVFCDFESTETLYTKYGVPIRVRLAFPMFLSIVHVKYFVSWF